MTKHQPSIVSTAVPTASADRVSGSNEDDTFHERVTEFVQWGSRLTPEEREWQITKLLPAILATLRDAADAVNAAAGQTPR